MKSGEHKIGRTKLTDTAANYASGLFYKYWHGYSKDEGKQLDFWSKTSELLGKGGEVHDRYWIKVRESELIDLGKGEASASLISIWAYGRVRLEDYCRHQGTLEDGRVVARVPVCGTSRQELAEVGILADTFMHEYPTETSGQNFTVILPKGWALRPVQTMTEEADTSTFQLADQQWAGVYDQNDTKVVSIFYSSRPYDSYDNFESHTRVEPAPHDKLS